MYDGYNVVDMNGYDALFIGTALLLNILVIGIYLTAKSQRPDLTKRIGNLILLLAIPFTVILIYYIATGQPLRLQLLLGLILIYLLIDLLLNRIFKIDFRKMLVPHILYIVLFYCVQYALISIAFNINRTAGWAVSVSFWVLLAALIYSLAGPKKQAFKETNN